MSDPVYISNTSGGVSRQSGKHGAAAMLSGMSQVDGGCSHGDNADILSKPFLVVSCGQTLKTTNLHFFFSLCGQDLNLKMPLFLLLDPRNIYWVIVK